MLDVTSDIAKICEVKKKSSKLLLVARILSNVLKLRVNKFRKILSSYTFYLTEVQPPEVFCKKRFS